MANDLYMVIVGVLFGLANVIPGVSGGTIAVVFGIYERLINLISDLRHRWRKDLRFLITFAIGAAIGILAFGKLMHWLLDNHPVVANSFFVGVILGSIPMIAKKALFKGKKPDIRLSTVLPGLITLGIMIFMAVKGTEKGGAVEVTGNYFVNFIKFLLFGIIASSCMIIPGISGSFVMVLIGAYGLVIGAVSGLTSGSFLQSALLLIPFGIGCVIGLFGCAKLIKWLMAKYEAPTYSAILGFVIGSVFTIFPGTAIFGLAPILAFLVGVACILVCNHYAPE